MITTAVTVKNLLGLHARAANLLAQHASLYQAQVSLEDPNAERTVDAKSIMQLLMMAAGQGSALVLHIDGEDEAAATEDLVALFNDGFGEPCG